MKKYLLLLFIAALCGGTVKANPGDTTWVQANIIKMDYFNNFDSTITFPDASKTYRKVYMVFTLGKYVCPSGSQYCGSWDYTVQTLFMAKHAADTVELGRFMTPYATTAAQNPRFPYSWTYRYIFDVTDYQTIMRDTATVRVHYSGYSGGFTGNIRFAFVEGTPERNVLGIERLWHGDFNYGHGTTPINTALGTLTRTIPASTQTSEVKMNITGHGGDDNSCAEFCPNQYSLTLDGNSLAQQSFYRSDCAANEIYPQTGTWIWARANWCPGALVNTISHTLTPVTAGNTYNIGMSFPAYTSTTNQQGTFPASYTIDAAAIYYGAMNKTLDASLEDIIAPTNAEYHYRENPNAMAPVVMVRNSGSSTINSIKFEYWVGNYAHQTYTWTAGNLASLQNMQITMPPFSDLRQVPGTYDFTVKIVEVNGQADNDALNDQLKSSFTAAPKLPADFRVAMNTNQETFPGNTARSQTSWRILDQSGTIVAQKVNCPKNSTCSDTVHLNLGESYRLVVTDSSFNGYLDIPSGNATGIWHGTGGGNILIYPVVGTPIPVTIPAAFSGDFGSGFSFDFYTGWATDVANVNYLNASLNAYPNPAKDVLSVSVDGIDNAKGRVVMVDMIGREVMQMDYTPGINEVNIQNIPNGIYQLVYKNAKDQNIRLQQRVVIAR